MFANLMPQEPPFFEMFAALAISCQAAMGLGTLFGGWRIVKTMGQRITRLKPLGGFAHRPVARARCLWQPGQAFRCRPRIQSPGLS
jgi:hypothetical protein